jgi:hypothetical protein
MTTEPIAADDGAVDWPIIREVHVAGEPHGYGWVRTTHTILRAGVVPAEPVPDRLEVTHD